MNDILSLNESIFGNKTKEKKVSRKTRKAMCSELYIPEDAVVMSYEDACSVDGGAVITNWMISVPIDIALSLCGGIGIALTGAKNLGRIFGKKLVERLLWSNIDTIAQTTLNVLFKLGSAGIGAAINFTTGQLGNLILNNFWSFTSLGGVISFVLDMTIDGKVNGIIHSW